MDLVNVNGNSGTRIGVVIYSLEAQNLFYLNSFSSLDQIKNAIMTAPYKGSYTNTSGGIRAMTFEQFTEDNGDRPNVPNVAIVITDGIANRDKGRYVL